MANKQGCAIIFFEKLPILQGTMTGIKIPILYQVVSKVFAFSPTILTEKSRENVSLIINIIFP